jgi:hypothetical protein
VPGKSLNWATSKTIGGVSEIAVLAPVRKGCPPQENRTYEQRLREVIDNIMQRHQKGFPTELSRVPSIHFGRLILIRPEQYLLYSNLPPEVVRYADPNQQRTSLSEAPETPTSKGALCVPLPLSDYLVQPPQPPNATATYPETVAASATKADATPTAPASTLRTWLLTLVEFDGDLRVYMRDIAEALSRDFDYIFENCEEYPGTANFERFWIWIRRFQMNTSLFYAPYSNLSVARIRQLEDFRNRFDHFVARVRPPTGPLESIDALFDEFLRETQQRVGDFPSPSGLFPNPTLGG